MNKIILASGSPRRKQLLEWAEISFEVMVADTDESYPENLSAAEIARHIAMNKALAIQGKLLPNYDAYTIIAADTIVVLENKIIGKPLDREDAIKILSVLSGKTHEVITGVCLLSFSKKKVFAEKTNVAFHELSLAQIEYYIDKYKPYDKAGAYAIQEWIGVVGVKSIEGDFYNVMGLPVSRVVGELKVMNSEL
ncbi:MAG TPA: Maf family nucleotide pyrophosphatase [Hanamia sp.]